MHRRVYCPVEKLTNARLKKNFRGADCVAVFVLVLVSWIKISELQDILKIQLIIADWRNLCNSPNFKAMKVIWLISLV